MKIFSCLAYSLVLLIVSSCFSSGDSISSEAMSTHFHEHEKDLRELVQYAESLSDSLCLTFPSDSIPSQISKEQYDHVLLLLRRTQCRTIKTYCHHVWGNNTMVVFRYVVFCSHGYIFLPDKSIKIFHWDPLGSEWSGLYEIE